MTKPYRDTAEHLLDELVRLDCLLRCYLEEWWAERGDMADEFRGLYVSDEEIDRLLRFGATDGRGGSSLRRHDYRDREDGYGREATVDRPERVERLRREIGERTRRAREQDTELRFIDLVERFDLESNHVDALLIVLAPELDRKYEKVYAYLQDDLTRPRPTVDLIARVLGRSAAGRLEARSLFSADSPLLEHRLVSLSGDASVPLPSRDVTVADRIVDFLLGTSGADTVLAGLGTVVEPTGTIADLPTDRAVRARLEALAEMHANRGDSEPLMAYFHGPRGAGKRAAVEALCALDGTRVVAADLAATSEFGHLETVRLLFREARLCDAPLFIENPSPRSDGDQDGHKTGDPEAIVRELDAFAGPVFLSSKEPMMPELGVPVENHTFATLEFSIPSYTRRRELWEAVDSLPRELDADDLAATFRLTGGQIADAVAAAETLSNGERLTPAAVRAGCRAQSRETLDSLARKVDPCYTWDDIVLPTDRMNHLREVAAHIKHGGTVYDEWGFEDKFSLGNGLNVLFSGASGTGKTMAAEIIAADAGLDLYKIDLAGVVSKYIGETERNLREIFDEAENSSVILLFDEADALFGKRSEVQDAHDRYANVEVNYLLQRVEEHDGTVILTTNFKRNIDDAFLRRLHLSVDFPLPDRNSREAIWRNVFPEETPVGELDVDFLRTFEITGGNIKNIALAAAFFAADDGGCVEMEHVIRAAWREFQKAGKLVNPEEFGEYRELIP